jgi:tetrahydromethanopterin S-methyltransferase subunit G
MSVVEDVRKVMQDFLAPELRGITARLDAVEKQIESLDRKTDRQHEEVMAAVRQVVDYTMVVQRLSKLEAQVQVKQ